MVAQQLLVRTRVPKDQAVEVEVDPRAVVVNLAEMEQTALSS
jgi:hypothetical protein